MITAVDAHACGEPGRVITGGVLDVPGKTMFEKMAWLQTHADDLRLRMLREPRGYPAANCNLILPPTASGGRRRLRHHGAGGVPADVRHEHHLRGHGADRNRHGSPTVEPVTHLKLETPAGLVAVHAEVRNGKVKRVTFRNVPAFATHLDATVEVRGIGTVTVDVAYGGMFYVIADAAPLGFALTPTKAATSCAWARWSRPRRASNCRLSHPENPGIAGVSIAQLSGAALAPGAHRKNTVVVSTGVFDWSRPPPGPARSTARPAAPAPAPRWPYCMPRGSCRSARISCTKAFSARCSPAG